MSNQEKTENNEYEIIFRNLEGKQDEVDVIRKISKESEAIDKLRKIVLDVNTSNCNYSIYTGSAVGQISGVDLCFPSN